MMKFAKQQSASAHHVQKLFRASRSSLLALALVLSAVSLGAAEAANWIPCGSERGTGRCDIPSGVRAVIRYGSDPKPGYASNGYYYWGTEGIASSPCNNFNGDPAEGIHKECAYTTDVSMLSPTGAYRFCANERGSCYVGTTPVWVRYGAPGRWYETIQTGVIACDNGFFNYDPASGQAKRCEVGGPVVVAESAWRGCASESSRCTPGSGASPTYGVLLRYGFGSNWTYRVAKDLTNLSCSNDGFSRDPYYGQHKSCEYVSLDAKALTMGVWDLRVSCENCASSNFTVNWGTDYNTTRQTTQEWSTTVTESMEGGFDIKGVSASVSVSVSQSYAHSSSFSTSVSTNYGQSVSVTCGTGSGRDNIWLYQFRTSTDSPCLASGACSGNTFTTQTFCALNPPVGYRGPQCLPGYCADALCTQCSYPSP
jgi:hypothetical protein